MGPARKRVDRGIYQLGPRLFEVAVSTGKDPVTGRYGQLFRRHHGTLTSARDFRRQLLREVETGEHRRTAGTLNDLFDAWLLELGRIGRAPKTIAGYRRDAETYWRPTLGPRPVHKITLRDIDEVLGGLIDRGLSPATLDHIHACLSSAFSQAKRWEWIDRDPSKLVRLPQVANQRPVVPTPEEVNVLYHAAERSERPEMARVIWLGAITGARGSEIRALRLSDFDLERGRMGIERAISAEKVWTTKNRQIRDNSLDALTVAQVSAQITFMRTRATAAGVVLEDDAYLFSDAADGRTHWREETITRFFSRLADDVGCGHLTFKHLRKFMATHGQELGFTDAQVASRAGHDPTVARRHYTGSIAATDLRLSTALAELLSPPSG